MAPLVPPEDPGRLAPGSPQRSTTRPRQGRCGERSAQRIGELFSHDAMVEGVLAGYGAAIGAKFKQSH